MSIFKKWMLAAIAVCIMAPSYGQVTDQGNFLIGANIGFSSANSETEQTLNGDPSGTEGSTASQFNITPSIGYFLANNFTLGIGMDYTYNSIERPNDEQANDSDLLFGPFARYYVPMENNMAFFMEGTLGFGSSDEESNIGDVAQDISNDVFAVGIGPGFTIISDNGIGIEALLKYNYAESDADFEFEGESVNVKTITNQIDFSVGIHVYFGRLSLDRVDTSDDNLDGADLY